MKSKIVTIVRILLGLLLVVFGANKFFGFMPMPEFPDAAGALMHAFAQSGYIMPAVAVVEIGVGLMLLINLFPPLAMVLLAPISVNIVLFHIFLDPAGIVPALVVAGLNLFLIICFLPAYLPMLSRGSKF